MEGDFHALVRAQKSWKSCSCGRGFGLAMVWLGEPWVSTTSSAVFPQNEAKWKLVQSCSEGLGSSAELDTALH